MPQIIKGNDLWSNVGQGIGGGLTKILSSHVANKARKYEQDSLAEKLAPHVGGIEKARAIAALGAQNPKAQQSWLSNIFGEQNKQANNEAAWNHINGGEEEQPAYQEQQFAPQPEQQPMPQQQERPNLQTPLQALTGLKPSFTEQQMLQSLVPQQVQQPQVQPQEKQQQIPPQMQAKQMGNMNAPSKRLQRIREAVVKHGLDPKILVEAEKAEKEKNKVNQREIDSNNAPYVKTLDVAKDNAEDIKNDAEELLELFETGNVTYGLTGYIPSFGRSKESNLFNGIATKIAGKLAAQHGIPTKYKIQYEERSKPSLSNASPEEQEAYIKKIINDANRKIIPHKFKDQIIRENNYLQPRNLETLVNERVEKLTKYVKDKNDKKKLSTLLNGNELYEDGQGIELMDTGNKYIMENGSWIEVE